MISNRWVILGAIFLARLSLGFQFQSAGSVTPFIVADLGVDYTTVGALVGLFMIPGLLLAVPAGVVGRRFGDKRIVLLGLGLMALGGVLTGSASVYDMVAFGRLVSGAGAAFLFVLMTKMVIDWFAGRELYIGMSVFILGWPVGIGVGQVTQPMIAASSSWGVVFHLTALLSLAGFAAIAVLYRVPPGAQERGPGAIRGLSGRELWLVCLVGVLWMLLNGSYVIYLSFGPVFLQEQGMSVGDASATVSLISWTFLVSLPLGAYLLNRYKATDRLILAGLFIAFGAALLIPYAGYPRVMFLLLGFGATLATPLIATLPAEALRPANRAAGLGIYYVWYFVGSAVFPVLGGYVRDLTGQATATLLVAAAIIGGSIVLVWLFRREQGRLPVAI